MKLKAFLMLAVGLAAVVGVMAFPLAAWAQTGPRIGQPAPEITGGPWINSPALSMDKLRGRVVVVEFWTYG